MKKRIAWLGILSLFFAMPALAQTEGEQALLTDYLGLCKVLRSRGIEPAHVNWLPVQNACLGLKEETDQRAYYQCEYRVIVDRSQYNNDTRACNAAGRASFPQALTTFAPTVTVTTTQGGTTTVTNNTRLTPGELRDGRLAAYDSCMRARGWNDPNNWGAGRSQN